MEQSDSGCLIPSHFGFGSGPSLFVGVISGKSTAEGGGGEHNVGSLLVRLGTTEFILSV